MTRDFYRVLQQLVTTVNTLRGEVVTVDDFSLGNMNDVAITTPANGEVLVFDGTNLIWINSP